ncbi:MAG: hypothetical protein K2M94_04005 [Paramuribaculum sp.]|nr:hypothetical protein [Paramuribaculum sp.]
MSEDNPDILPETPAEEAYTVKEYLQGISPLLTENVLRVILAKRHLSPDTPLEDLDEKEADLAEAEVYYHLSNLPVGGATTKDVDGSWSHTEGGWTVSGANIAEWYRKYAALREKWGEEVITKRKIRIINF